MFSQYANLIIINSNFVTEIQHARRLQDDSLRAKTGFLAGLSHELRGPLGVILNASEILRDELMGPLTEQQKEMMTMVLSNGEHLLELLNDVLDYARVEAGKVAPQKTRIAVAEIIRELSKVVQVQAQAKKQKVTVNIDFEGDILCDRRHFRQVLINLLTNAVKYTPENGLIEISAQRLAGQKIAISVSDTGCGIAASDFGKVFGAFERVTHGYASEQSGTGLGMPLSKKLIEVNGGSIEFTSEVGKGSRFTVILSEERQITQSDSLLESQPKQAQRRDGIHVLFVGAESKENQLLTDYLKSKKCLIELFNPAKSPHIDFQPHIIIVDESYKQAFSDETFNSIRKKLHAVSLPLMYLSRDAFNFSIEEQLKEGVDRFIAKPSSLDAIFEEICRLAIENTRESIVH